MYYAHDESWNLRDTHMFQTLVRILKHRGDQSKAIIWAHNSHVGDARATSMGQAGGQLNIGQLCKEAFGETMALTIGCSTNTGTVAAASQWDGDLQIMSVVPALPMSYEGLMHDTGIPSFMLDLRDSRCDKRLREELMRRRLERFIGVVYKPSTERASHYSSAILPKQFDAFVWFEKTTAVRAFETHQPQTPVEFDETWPFGL
jgi:erythromycin esterase-like protein